MTTRSRSALAVCAAAATVIACCGAAPPEPIRPTAAQQARLEQVALGKARTQMFTLLHTLPAGDGRVLGDRLAGEVARDRALRLWVRSQPREGPARLYDDGVCEVDVRVAPGALRDALAQIADEHPAEADGIADLVPRAADDWPILWTTGRAEFDRHAETAGHPGWEDVSAAGAVLAQRAAAADARHALLEQAGRLKLTPARRLDEFLDSSAAVRAAVVAALESEARVEVTFEPDQIAVAAARIGIRDLLRILTRVHAEHYRGDEFMAADFRQMVLLAGRDELVAEGLAPPPPDSRLRDRFTTIEYNRPPWAAEVARATGRYEPAEVDPLSAAARADAARLDAVDALRLRVEQLAIQDTVTVTDFVGYHQDLKHDVVLFLSGARVTAPPRTSADGIVTVAVELPLQRLWEIVRRRMVLEEVTPSTAPAAPPAVSGPAH